MWDRRTFLTRSGLGLCGAIKMRSLNATKSSPEASRATTLFLCGDVMTGRGIDQILPFPSHPEIHEAYMKSALGYVELAEQKSGPIPSPVDFSYIWGQALVELERVKPDIRIINLETSVTTSQDWYPKGINYRMHPKNAPCLTAAGIDCCSLANNHVLDWGSSGLSETLETIALAGITPAGAGQTRRQAELPAVMEIPGKGRVLVFSFGTVTSGIPPDWAATAESAGVNLKDLSENTVNDLAEVVDEIRRPGDVVVASMHWGGNWGYEIPEVQRQFAHRLIEEAGIDIIYGHSSHHVKGMEVYRGKPILYGCGDFINDYEGISGHERFRSNLVLMFFVTMEGTPSRLMQLEMTPLEIRKFRLNRATREDAIWLENTLSREGEILGTQAKLQPNNTLELHWER